MDTLLAFAVTLLVAVLVSDLTSRSVLSTSVLFLVAGFMAGPGMLNLIDVTAGHPVVERFSELALFSVLYTEGMRVTARQIATAWELPGRALFLGLPLTMAVIATLGHLVVGLSWLDALLVGAALGPTDPVFAAAIVGREEIPWKVRHLLNVESGLNDGLALPVVIILLGLLSPQEQSDLPQILGEVTLGIIVGIVIPWGAMHLERNRFFVVARDYRPLYAFAVGVLLLAATSLAHANEFLAAFAGGITMASVSPDLRDAFGQFGSLVAELFKLAGLLVFGAVISPAFLAQISWDGYLFAVLVWLFARPVALGLSLIGSGLTWPEWLTVAWFGPRGFASVFYGLLILHAGIANGQELFHLIALVISGSIIAHSSTDVPVARWFRTKEPP